MKYSSQKEENRHYVEIAKFLAASDINVPAIYFHDASEGLIWMQDLGDEDLWSWRKAPWERRRPLYESALFEVSKLHIVATQNPAELRLCGSSASSANNSISGSSSIFSTTACARTLVWNETAVRRYAELPVMHGIAARLASLPRVLVHRDFQSQNILIPMTTAWLIDFQGMRPGLPQYDIASLSIRSLRRPDRRRAWPAPGVLQIGCAPRAEWKSTGDFDQVFHFCALQRLMQALGAYGFLGLQKGRPDFLAHIPAARRSLREVAARIDGLDEFVALLDLLP